MLFPPKNTGAHVPLRSALLAVVASLLAGPVAIRAQASAPNPPAVQQPAPQQPAAQQPAEAGGEKSQEPDIRSNVDEVSVDMVVRNKRHKPVLDLQPTDLTVTDNGTPVKLDTLHLVRGEAAHGHLVALVFDQFAGPLAKQCRNTAEKVLKVLPTQGYSVAVLNFAGRLRLMQDYTADRKAVENAIQVVTASNATQLTSTLSEQISITTDKAEPARAQLSKAAETNLISEARRGVNTQGQNITPEERAHAKILLAALEDGQKIMQDEPNMYHDLAGLLALIKAQQQAPERKAIIYFTRNKTMDTTAKDQIKALASAAERANVSIYTIDLDAMNEGGASDYSNAKFNAPAPYDSVGRNEKDPLNGRVGPPMQQPGGAPIQGTVSVASGPVPIASAPNWGTQQDIAMMTDFTRFSGDYEMFAHKHSPMADLAKQSGGMYIDIQMGLKRQLNDMAQDLSTYYEATYVPPIKEYDGKYHTIGVKTGRKNVLIDSKNGYYAIPPGAEAGLRPFEVPLLKLLDDKTLPSNVDFDAKVLSFGEMPDGPMSSMAIEVPLDAIKVHKDTHTNIYTAHVQIEARIHDAHGMQIERIGEDLSKRGALPGLDRDSTASIAVARHFTCAPGHYIMEVAVSDVLGGKIGAQRIEFDVPDPNKATALSDIVLVRKVDSVPAQDEDPVEPLRYENSKITPNIMGSLPEHARGVQLFFILHPDANAKDDPTLEMQVLHNGTPGRRTPLPLHLGPAGMPVPYLASFGNKPLAPGRYEIRAYLNQDGRTTLREAEFTVAGKEDPNAAAQPEYAAGVSDDSAVVGEHRAAGQLAIVPVTTAVQPPSEAETKQLLDDARKTALGYGDSLPNFLCLQVTNRSFDTTGYGRWKLRDSLVEVLRYRDKQESRTLLTVNGRSSTGSRAGLKGSISTGEFGGVLRAIFSDSAKANFKWKETDSLKNGTVQVFDYTVDKQNSMFTVVGSNNEQIYVSFRGQVFIDSTTHSVRRLTLIADNLPKNFPTHATRIDVDYDYVAINDHDYLVPVSAEMRLVQGKHEAVLNTMEFRGYRRYGSNMKILGYKPVND
ncbi:MAG: VWA domain-containing protein [Acidobacteriota bacterium]